MRDVVVPARLLSNDLVLCAIVLPQLTLRLLVCGYRASLGILSERGAEVAEDAELEGRPQAGLSI